MTMKPETNVNPNYKLIRFPLVGDAKNRSDSSAKDQRFVNVMFDVNKNPATEGRTIFCTSRGGFVPELTVVGGGGEGRGLHYWGKTGKIYTVIGSKLYSDTTDIHTLTTSTGTCWFCETIGTSELLILSDGVKLYTINSSDVVTEITDPDLPANPITPVTMDGYLVVAKSDTDEIYNSDVDDPTSWDPANFLAAEMYPDKIVALARHVGYIVVFGSYSTELFYDNANPSGSPFKRNEAVALKVGLAARDTVAQTDRRIVFVGQADSGEPKIWMLAGLTPERISTEFQDKILASEGANLANASAWIAHHAGHTLYILNLTNRTLVYDLDEKLWSEWSYNNLGNHTVLPFKYACQGASNKLLTLHSTNGKVYRLDNNVYQDEGSDILVEITTGLFDMGTNRQKRMFKLEIVGDIIPTGICTLQWTDDDYNSWYASRTLNIASRPYLKALGTFRRRAFRLKYAGNARFRVEALEIYYSDGIH